MPKLLPSVIAAILGMLARCDRVPPSRDLLPNGSFALSTRAEELPDAWTAEPPTRWNQDLSLSPGPGLSFLATPVAAQLLSSPIALRSGRRYLTECQAIVLSQVLPADALGLALVWLDAQQAPVAEVETRTDGGCQGRWCTLSTSGVARGPWAIVRLRKTASTWFTGRVATCHLYAAP